jgi:hypothetical protein
MDLKTDYGGIGVGGGSGTNGTGRMNMDDIYQEVSTSRSCIIDSHSNLNSEKFIECYIAPE